MHVFLLYLVLLLCYQITKMLRILLELSLDIFILQVILDVLLVDDKELFFEHQNEILDDLIYEELCVLILQGS